MLRTTPNASDASSEVALPVDASTCSSSIREAPRTTQICCWRVSGEKFPTTAAVMLEGGMRLRLRTAQRV
jgi:hypothetical protein